MKARHQWVRSGWLRVLSKFVRIGSVAGPRWISWEVEHMSSSAASSDQEPSAGLASLNRVRAKPRVNPSI